MKRLNLKNTFIVVLLSFGLLTLPTSCLLYKSPSNEKMQDLKDTSVLSENMEIPDEWIFSREDSLNNEFNLDWFKELQDPTLTSIIKEGLQYNSTIFISSEKLKQIEIAMGMSGSNLYPSVYGVGTGYTNLNTLNSLESLTFQASWELDIWGKNKSRFEADKRNFFSANYENEKVKQSIAGMIAKSYFLNIAGKLQMEKFNDLLAKTEELKRLTVLRQKVGVANAVDVSNSNIEINQLKSQITSLQNANVQSSRALEILLGRYPAGIIETKESFPKLHNQIPETFPFSLLENRPDILSKHYQIERAFLEIQEARAARLPSLKLSSSFGIAHSNVAVINDLFSNPLINIGGNLLTPLFNSGKLKKNIEITNIEQRITIEEYSQTVLNALNEVETALGNLHAYNTQYTYDVQAIEELKSNLELTEKQISLGTNNTFVLLQKQRELLQTEIRLINLELNSIIERINLYIALGGNEFTN